ncbi:hypothetical protein Tco_0460914 [Tanacetum coccineum]
MGGARGGAYAIDGGICVPAIYMHEFWATVSFHKQYIKFKLNKKNHSFDLETFRDMLQICLNIPGQKFVDPQFEEEILAFIRTLGYSGDIKSLSDVKYGAILPDTLTNQAMKESDAYKTYYDFATEKVIPKPKLKATAKVAKSGNKKLPTQGLETLSEIALSEADQMKLITIKNKTQFHLSHASGSGANEGTSVSLGVPDVPTYGSEDEQISWKSSDEDDDDEVSMSKDDDDNADNEDNDDQDDDNEQTESDNDGDDFVHPKFSTDGDNVEEEKLDEEKTNDEEAVNEMYNDVNVNLEGRDTEMTDTLLANVQATQVIEDTHVIIIVVTPEVQHQSSFVSSCFISKMLYPNPDTSIDSILNLNIESTSLVDVLVTTNDEIPPSSVTTIPPPPIPLIQPLQQTPVSTPKIVPISLILGIVDKYLTNQMNEAIKAVVQLQKSSRSKSKYKLRSKSLPRIEKSVSEQLEAEVLIRSSNKAKTSHAVAANLFELELKKILIDKYENKKSIDRSVQQRTLYKALVDAYETDKDILATYGDTVTFKRRRDDEDEDDEPSAGSNRGLKRRKAGKEPYFTRAPKDKMSKSTGSSKEGSKSKTRSTDKSA